MSVNDVHTATANEVAYAQGLGAIPFTGQTAVDANQLGAQSRQLAADLLQSIAEPPNSDLVARIRQNDYDPTPYEALRVDMGLPPHGTCSFTTMYYRFDQARNAPEYRAVRTCTARPSERS